MLREVAGDLLGLRSSLVASLTRTGAEADVPQIAAAIRASAADRQGVEVHVVALVRRGGVLKTTSGKVRRLACRDRYLSAALPLVGLDSLDGSSLDTLALGAAEPTLPDLSDVDPTDRVQVLATTAAGMDSLVAVELEHLIQDRSRVELPPLALLGDRTPVEFPHRCHRSPHGFDGPGCGRAAGCS